MDRDFNYQITGRRLPSNLLQWILGVGLVIGIVALMIAGFSILSVVVLVVLVALVVYFGSIGVLASSVVVGVLLKFLSGTLQAFTSVWVDPATTARFYSFVNETGYVEMIGLIFLLAYALRFFTGSIRLFHFDNRVDVKPKPDGQ